MYSQWVEDEKGLGVSILKLGQQYREEKLLIVLIYPWLLISFYCFGGKLLFILVVCKLVKVQSSSMKGITYKVNHDMLCEIYTWGKYEGKEPGSAERKQEHLFSFFFPQSSKEKTCTHLGK